MDQMIDESKGFFACDINQEEAGANDGLYFSKDGARLVAVSCGSCFGNIILKWNDPDFEYKFRCPKCTMMLDCRPNESAIIR